MKKYNKLIATSALVLGLTVAGVGSAYAAQTSTTRPDPMGNLVNAIAKKFNLNVSDVQKVFDEQRAQMEEARSQNEQARLAQAVADGKLTQDQANKIIAKKAELDAARESLQASLAGKTEKEKMAAMKTQITNLKQWATDNNIPMEYMFFLGEHGDQGHMGRGFGGMGKKKHNNLPATVTQ